MSADDAEGDDPAPARQLGVANRQNACCTTAQDEADRDRRSGAKTTTMIYAE